MTATYMYRIRMFCTIYPAILSKYTDGVIIHRFYCNSRSERSYVNENYEYTKRYEKFQKPVSKLFLSGREASRMFAIFCPELDFDYIINNGKKISEELKRRKVTINLPILIENLKCIKGLKEQINSINATKENVTFDANSENKDISKMDMLREKGKALKKRLKDLNTVLWNYEDVTFPELAKLPNRIHSETPSQNEVLTEHSIKDEFSFHVKSHVELGRLSQTIKFSNISPCAYYLHNLAAVLELAISNYFADIMTNAGFLGIINPDFCKSAVLEGCGKKLEEISQSITLKAHQVDGHSLHLTGSASLEGFVSSLSRIIVNNTSLPLLYFSIGHCYHFIEKNEQNLFSVAQAIKVTAFVASVESDSMNHFSSLVDIIETSYKNINIPFRSVKMAAHFLKPVESLKVQFDLWSPHRNEFVNVAHVSLCTDYISRRLMMKHGTERKAESFLHVVEATVTSLPVVIGCIMENMQTIEGTFSIPDIFKPYLNNILKT